MRRPLPHLLVVLFAASAPACAPISAGTAPGSDAGSIVNGGAIGDGGASSDGGANADDGGSDGGRKELPPPSHVQATRPAAVLVPRAYDARTPLPVVLALAGYDNRATDFDGWLHLSALVDELGFILVMPDGLVDSDGSPYWNATDTCCDFHQSGVDDVAYLRAVLAEVSQRFATDPARVGIIGHSNGAFMGYRMACEGAGIAGLVSIAGSTFNDERNCHATSGISILQVHGTADDTMPFGGDEDAPGALEVLRRWAIRDACDTTGLHEDATPREYAADHRADETTVSRYTGCRPGYDIELWALAGANHYPPFRPAFTKDALLWLLGQRR